MLVLWWNWVTVKKMNSSRLRYLNVELGYTSIWGRFLKDKMYHNVELVISRTILSAH